jgi:hypothetical protein
MEDLFRRRAKAAPGAADAAGANAGGYEARAESSTGPDPFNDRFRGMTDARFRPGADGRQRNGERRYADYDDEDL